MKKIRKSAKARLKEGRGTGVGSEYQPFIKAEEARSTGTATRMYDAQQGRSIHALSRSELSFYLTSKYYFAKAGNPIRYVNEQYPLQMDTVNRIRREMGLKNTPPSVVYSTDFVFILQDGQKRAYSIKSTADEFRRSSKDGKERKKAVDRLEVRQEIERRYWNEQNVPFAIVTGDTLNTTLASNLRTLHIHSDERFIVNTEQKALWLAAHGFINISNIETERISPKKVSESLSIDVDSFYDHIIEKKEEYVNGQQQ